METDKRLNEIIRVVKRPSSYVMMDKTFLYDTRLTWKAKGILAYLFSKPDNWKVIVGDIVKQSTDGKYAVYNGLTELQKYGYYRRQPIRDAKGMFRYWESIVYEIPELAEQETAERIDTAETLENTASYPFPSFPEMGNPDMGNPYLGNRDDNKNDSTKNDSNKNDNTNNYISNNICSLVCPSVLKDKEEETDGTDDAKQTVEEYTEMVKENIAYEDLKVTHPVDIPLVDEFVAVAVDALASESKYIRIDGEAKPRALVESRLAKLSYGNILHAVDQYNGVTERIVKKRPYMLTLLYNCTIEMHAHYINAVSYNRFDDT